jgi:Arylsulfotransferase (ASST)
MRPRSLAVFAVAVVAGAFACSGVVVEGQSTDGGADARVDTGADTGRDAPHDGGAPTGSPYLTRLDVSASGDGGVPEVELVPSFSSKVFDYYVRCAAEANTLTVSLTAAPGALGAIVQPTASAASPSQTVTLGVNENQAIVATATAGSATTEYWVRCLPHDFPPMKMTPHAGAGTPPPGYYLVGTSLPAIGAPWGYAMILNGDGVPVWYAHGPAASGIQDVDDVVPGAVSFFPTSGQGVIEIDQLDPWATTSAAPSGAPLDIHELRVLPSGHYLVLSNPTTTGVDLTGVSIHEADGGTVELGPGSSIVDCDIVEFDPTTGAVAWQWVGSEHFDPAKDSTGHQVAFGVTSPDGGQVIDVFHCNSIDVDPASGNLLVSARYMNALFYVERSTGDVLWKMGGVAYTPDHAPYVPVDDAFYEQHDARLLPGWSEACSGGSGQVSMFDDHTGGRGPARGIVYDVVVGAADGGTTAGDCGTSEGGAPGATVAWQYEGTSSSDDRGSFRVGADGSRVIDWGTIGPRHPVFTEVDVMGRDLLDFYFTQNDVSYRAIKAPLTAFDLGVLRTTAGL